MASLSENRKARFDYAVSENLTAGLELKGFEVKSAKNGRANLAGAQAIYRGGEFWLVGVDIPPYQPKNIPADYDSRRSRRLLLTHQEINYLAGRLKEKGSTLIPLRLFLKNNFVKVELGLAHRKKKTDKREIIKKEIARREMRVSG
ncbi:MAG: SsrA-binding protein SmpB [Patescibacteria group bacterium]|nr:SsrA-binding protein SmpB [Patescibacteria group bacterium]